MKKVCSTIFAIALLASVSSSRAEDNDSGKLEHRPDVLCFENTESTCSDAIGPEEKEKTKCNLEILNKCEIVKSNEVFQKVKTTEDFKGLESPEELRAVGYASRAIFRVRERVTYDSVNHLGQVMGSEYSRVEDKVDGFLNAYFPDFALLLAIRGLNYPFDADLDLTSKLAGGEVPAFEATIKDAEKIAISKCEAAFRKYLTSVPTCDNL